MNSHQVLKAPALALLLAVSLASAQAADLTDTNGAGGPEAAKVPSPAGSEIWKDPSQPLDARVHDLVSRLSLEEKASQILANPPAIPRLGIPAYSHRNECLHGVGDAGIATVFPQAIGMAATWDIPLIHEEADVIATEGRAKHNDYVAKHDGNTGEHVGLNFYSPNINIFRDPRWGRGQETYGEDPFLTAQFGVAFIRGLQGDDPRYIKAMACAKHYAVHSGPESERHRYDAKPSERDLYETYLPAFEAAVREGHVASAMGAYSSLNGLPCCADPFLLTDVLRKQWGFDGVVFSDGGAIGDIWAEHKYVATPEEAAAAAVKAGCDVSSGGMAPLARGAATRPGHANDGIKGGSAFSVLPDAVAKGLISEAEIDTAVSRELTARFRLGMFDPPAMVPWSNIGIEQNDTPEHQALALKVAEESIVLLKNNGLLPLNRAKIKRIAVVGPNADLVDVLQGSYNGTASHPVTLLAGIKQVAGTGIEVTYEAGCPLALKNNGSNQPTSDLTTRAVAAAKAADLVIFVGGISPQLEAEEKRNVDAIGFSGGDRTRIELPLVQEDLIKVLYATGKPVVLVNCSGSAMALPWEAGKLPAIVQAWYSGEQGGRAVAEVLFGDENPAARLPVTFYRSSADLPSFEDYSMSNRTYRYFGGKPLFPFGHGLSYTKFKYARAKLNAKSFESDDTLKFSFTVKNTGARDGDEVAQVYFRHLNSNVPQPKQALCGFARLHVAKGENASATVDIPAKQFRYWDTVKKQYVVEPGKYELLLGAASDDIRARVPFVIESE